jgi:hypothetical protein
MLLGRIKLSSHMDARMIIRFKFRFYQRNYRYVRFKSGWASCALTILATKGIYNAGVSIGGPGF